MNKNKSNNIMKYKSSPNIKTNNKIKMLISSVTKAVNNPILNKVLANIHLINLIVQSKIMIFKRGSKFMGKMGIY